MKIDRKKIGNRTGCDEPVCRQLAQKLASIESDNELITAISKVRNWSYGKCELGLWADLLDRFDVILERAVTLVPGANWTLALDAPEPEAIELRRSVVAVLEFTSHLVEHSIYRFLYSSLECVTRLLTATADHSVLLAVLQLLYVFSKRSNYLADRIESDRRREIVKVLYCLADTWGGSAAGLSLSAVSALDVNLPDSAAAVHIEYMLKNHERQQITLERIDTRQMNLCEHMERLIALHPLLPDSQRTELFAKLRLANALSQDHVSRLRCVRARLLALSILSYNFSLDDTTAYDGLLEELVDVLKQPSPLAEDQMMNSMAASADWILELQANVLRTLTALLHSSRRNFLLADVLKACGAGAPRGVLPSLVRFTVTQLVEGRVVPGHGQHLLTALLSFLYHLASGDEQEQQNSGNDSRLAGAALLSSMLKLVDWHTRREDCLTFATRAVRVTDQVTGGASANGSASGAGAHGGGVDRHAVLQTILRRLEYELSFCDESTSDGECVTASRAALMKSLLTLVKRVISEPEWAEPVRYAMDGGALPSALIGLVHKRVYFGPQLLLNSLDVVANYVFQEPSQLSSLQEKGLTEELLSGLTSGPLPVWRDLLTELPRILTALALNQRGAAAVLSSSIIKQLLRTLLQEEYLPAMRFKTRDGALEQGALGRNAPNLLGYKLDEMARAQTALRAPLMEAVVDTLRELVDMRNTDSVHVSNSAGAPGANATTTSSSSSSLCQLTTDTMVEGISDEDEEDNEDDQGAENVSANIDSSASSASAEGGKAQPTRLSTLYMLHFVTFLDSLLSCGVSSSSQQQQQGDQLMRDFVLRGGPSLLLRLVSSPNVRLSEEFTQQSECQLIAAVLKQAFQSQQESAGLHLLLKDVLSALHQQLVSININIAELREGSDEPPLHSLFLRDQLAGTGKDVVQDLEGGNVQSEQQQQGGSLLRNLTLVHTLLIILEGMARLNGREQRTATLQLMSQDTGLEVLVLLRDLYLALVWENAVLLSICCEETELCREDLRQLELTCVTDKMNIDNDAVAPLPLIHSIPAATSDDAGANFSIFKPMPHVGSTIGRCPAQLRQRVQAYLKFVTRSSRVITDLFSLLVRQCAGAAGANQQRHHRRHQPPPVPLPAAVQLSAVVTKLMNKCFQWRPAEDKHFPDKLVYSYYVAGIGFASAVLFDSQRLPLLLLLRSFVATGTLCSYFELFRAVVLRPDNTLQYNGEKYAARRECLLEFIEAWLAVLERLSNAQLLAESPHRNLVGDGMSSEVFDLSGYLEQVHALSFAVLEPVWRCLPAQLLGRGAPLSLLSVMHGLVTEWQHRLEQLQHVSANASTTTATSLPLNNGEVASALCAAPAVVLPTLLPRGIQMEQVQQLSDMGFPHTLCVDALVTAGSLEQAMEWLLTQVPQEMQENVAMERAVALSMSMDVSSDTALSNKASTWVLFNSVGGASGSQFLQHSSSSDTLPVKGPEPVVWQAFLREHFLGGALRILDAHHETVHGLADLLHLCAQEELLRALFQQTVDGLRSAYYARQDVGRRLHLVLLVFARAKRICRQLAVEVGLAAALLEALRGWRERHRGHLAPICLLLDLLERSGHAAKLRQESVAALRGCRTWKWFDERTGIWTAFNEESCAAIHRAWLAGEDQVRVTVQRARRYTIVFAAMLQFNEDTQHARPVILWPEKCDDEDRGVCDPEAVCTNNDGDDLQVLNSEQRDELLRLLAGALDSSLEEEALNAALRLLLRLCQQDYGAACHLADLGVLERLLASPLPTADQALPGLLLLLMRQIFEEPAALEEAMVAFLRHILDKSGLICSYLGVNGIAQSGRELMYLLQVLAGPLMLRNRAVALSAFRRAMSLKLEEAWVRNGRMNDFYQVVARQEEHNDGRANASAVQINERQAAILQQMLLLLLNDPSTEDGGVRTNPPSNQSGTSEESQDSQKTVAASSDKSFRRLSQLRLLRLLSELVKCFPVASEWFLRHRCSSGETALTALIDVFLLNSRSLVEESAICADQCRSLLCALVNSGGPNSIKSAAPATLESHRQEAQSRLVAELKSAFHRATMLVEGQAKHDALQALTKLTDTLLVPAAGGAAPYFLRQLQRRSIISDLARLPASIDLSSPHAPETLSQVLKTLETLTKVCQQEKDEAISAFGATSEKNSSGIGGGAPGNAMSGTRRSGNRRSHTLPSILRRSRENAPPSTTQESRTELNPEDLGAAVDVDAAAATAAANDALTELESDMAMANSSGDEDATVAETLTAMLERQSEERDEAMDEQQVGQFILFEDGEDDDDDNDDDMPNENQAAVTSQDESEPDVNMENDHVIVSMGSVGDAEDVDTEEDEEEEEDEDEDDDEDEEEEEIGNDLIGESENSSASDESSGESENDDDHGYVNMERMDGESGLGMRDGRQVILLASQDGLGSIAAARREFRELRVPLHHLNRISNHQDWTSWPPPLTAMSSVGATSHQSVQLLHPLMRSHTSNNTPATAASSASNDAAAASRDLSRQGQLMRHGWLRGTTFQGQLPRFFGFSTNVGHMWMPQALELGVMAPLNASLGISGFSRGVGGIREVTGGGVAALPTSGSGLPSLLEANSRASDGDSFFWDLLCEFSSDSELPSCTSRAALYPNFMRWVDAARILAGREMQDLVMIAQSQIFPYLDHLRHVQFKERLAEYTKLQETATLPPTIAVEDMTVKSGSSASNSRLFTPELFVAADTAAATATVAAEQPPCSVATEPTTIDNQHDADHANTLGSEEEAMDQDLNDVGGVSLLDGMQVAMQEESDVSTMEPIAFHDLTAALNQALAAVDSVTQQLQQQAAAVSADIEAMERGETEQLVVTEHRAEQNTPPSQSNEELFDGLDPAVLEALPEDIRQEVIADHLRQRRIRQLAAIQSAANLTGVSVDLAAGAAGTPVDSHGTQLMMPPNAEFLAALPAHIQEEVLAQYQQQQQQVAQQQHAAQQGSSAAAAALSAPVDPSAVLSSLPANVRREVLADMDDSNLATLPAELAEEARQLRQESERRFVRLHERLYERLYTTTSDQFPEDLHDFIRLGRQVSDVTRSVTAAASNTAAERFRYAARVPGKLLIDHEGLTTLMALLFARCGDRSTTASADPEGLRGATRRVLRNACLHAGTRHWVLRTLLAILHRATANSPGAGSQFTPAPFPPVLPPLLDLRFDAALGTRARVFQLVRPSSMVKAQAVVGVHPQASMLVCKVVLDTMHDLAKIFMHQFLPPEARQLLQDDTTAAVEHGAEMLSLPVDTATDFWDLLGVIEPSSSNYSAQRSRRVSENVVSVSTSNESAALGELGDVFAAICHLVHHDMIFNNPTLLDLLMRTLCYVTQQLRAAIERRKEPVKPIALRPVDAAALERLVQILTESRCSETGLESTTHVLLTLSKLCDSTRSRTLTLLLDGVVSLAQRLQDELNALVMELLSAEQRQKQLELDDSARQVAWIPHGSVVDRFQSGQRVVITAEAGGVALSRAAATELQLPSLGAFLSHKSAQTRFLKLLTIFRSLRQQQLSSISPTSSSSAVDAAASSSTLSADQEVLNISDWAEGMMELQELWDQLSTCLSALERSVDPTAVLLLQPAVEAFCLAHAAPESSSTAAQRSTSAAATSATAAPSPAPTADSLLTSAQAAQQVMPRNSNTQLDALDPRSRALVQFAERHRTVLNEILRSQSTPLSEGPFRALVDTPRVLDFDVKRTWFRQELEKNRTGSERLRDGEVLRVSRARVFEDSFARLHRKTAHEWKQRFTIVFQGEEGQDAGGLLRDWYSIITKEILNPNYALFKRSPGDRVTYMINAASFVNSNHLAYFKFVGRLLAKAIHDNKLLDCYFTRSFYKHILGVPVRYQDMESEDQEFYKGLVFLLEHHIDELGSELSFSVEMTEFGRTEVRDLVPDGRNKPVIEENKKEYVRLVCQERMTGAIRQQLNAFLEGFHELIPRHLIAIFTEAELELLISGLPTVDVEDLRAHTEYHKYQVSSVQIQWFWRALRGMDQAERARFLQFVTGTSKVPLGGFAFLEGMQGLQRFQICKDSRSTDHLPTAHTCYNQLVLPPYESFEKLRQRLFMAMDECDDFGLA